MLFQFRIVNELDGDLVKFWVLIVDLFASFLLTICSWVSPQPVTNVSLHEQPPNKGGGIASVVILCFVGLIYIGIITVYYSVCKCKGEYSKFKDKCLEAKIIE